MAKHKALNAAALKMLPPGRYADGGGLYFEVKAPAIDQKNPRARRTIGRVWLFRYHTGGRVRWKGFGVC